MIKNIIFDIGDVLVKTRELGFFTDKGYDAYTADSLAKATYLTPYWKELDRGVWSYKRIVDAFVENTPSLEKEIRYSMRDLGGFIERNFCSKTWIKRLRAHGMRVYCLSNISSKIYYDCKSELDFLSVLNGYVFSYQERVIKPDPEIYKVLLRRYSLKADESIFIDDRFENINAARSLGFHGIVYKSIEQAEGEIAHIRRESK